LFPQCDDLSKKGDHGFTPHLTHGQATGNKALSQRCDEFESSWSPFKFVVEQIYIISRTDSSPFKIIHTIPLAQYLNTSMINNMMNNDTTLRDDGDDMFGFGFFQDDPIPRVTPEEVPIQNKIVEKNIILNRSGEDMLFNMFSDDNDTKEVKEEPTPTISLPSSEVFISKLNLNEDDFGVILKKVASWLFHQNELGKLPKSKDKLSKSLTKMCFYMKKIDINFIKNYLKEKGYFAAYTDTYFEFNKKGIEKFQLKTTNRNQTDEDIVIEKCIKWIETREHYPKTATLIDKAFSQLCVLKKYFDVDDILVYFTEKGVINYDYNNISYNFN